MTLIQTTPHQYPPSIDPTTRLPMDPGSEGPSSLLPDTCATPLGGDSITQLMALVTRDDQKDKTGAHAAEAMAEKAAADQDQQRYQAMMDKASQDEFSGLASGICTTIGGGLTAASTIPNATNWQTVVGASGTASPGVGTMIVAPLKSNADRDDANAAKYEAHSQAAIRQYDLAHDDAQGADASVQKVEQFLQTFQQTENEGRTAAATMLKG